MINSCVGIQTEVTKQLIHDKLCQGWWRLNKILPDGGDSELQPESKSSAPVRLLKVLVAISTLHKHS